MTAFLKQSTAETVVFGPFVDSTDGVTAETALTISQADIRLSKNGGAFAQTNNAAGATHMEFGHYSIPLNTTDTNTLGRLRVAVNESGALPVWRDFMVMPANVWDSLYGADQLQVHVNEMTAGIITAAVIATDAIDADAIADNAINAAAIANDAITDAKVASDVTIASVTGAVGSVTGAVGSVTGNVGGNVVGSVASVTAGVTLAASAVQAIWDALTSALTTVGSIGKLLVDNINATISSRLASASYTAPPTAAANADAVWDETLADHLSAGSTGNALNAAGGAGDPWSTALPGAYGAGTAGKILGDNINATISSRATQVSVDDLPTNAELATSQAAADDATLAAIAALNNLSAAQVNTEVDTALADYDAPTFAELDARTDAIDAAIATRASQASVDDLPTNAELATSQAAADDATLAAIAALNNLSLAQVNAEVLDVLTIDTFAEPSAVPAATSTLKDKINWLFILARNKLTQTSTTQLIRNDADAATVGTATVSDDGTTAIRGEFS